MNVGPARWALELSLFSALSAPNEAADIQSYVTKGEITSATQKPARESARTEN